MIVLDANTISYYFRGDPQVVPKLLAIRPSDIGVPSIVEYELRYGLMRLPAQAAAPRMQALNQLLRPMQTLPFDNACAEQAAQIRANLEAIGKPIGPHDTLIAAIAMRYQSTLVTRNVAEFSRVQGLNVLNWHA